MFSSLKIREFRIFWWVMLISLVGSWIQAMAQSWLVFEMTRSAFLIGLTGFLGNLPITFFSIPAGVWVDRMSKRRIIFVTQSLFTILALLLALLVYSKTVQTWHIIFIAALNGLVLSVDAPARQAIVVEFVGREHLLNAIALNSAAFNTARILGPAVAGVLIATIGMAGCFMLNAVSFLPVLVALFLVRPRFVPARNASKDFWQDMKASFSLVRRQQFLLVLLLLVGLLSTFAVSYAMLMPIFAQDILHSGAKGLAILMSASGVGSLIGALHLARLGKGESTWRVFHLSIVIFFVSAMSFGLSKDIFLSSVFLIFAGYGATGSLSLANTLSQINTPDAYRGRMMGLFMTMFMGVVPFVNLIIGSAAHVFGAPIVVFTGGLLGLGIYAVVKVRYLHPSVLRAIQI